MGKESVFFSCLIILIVFEIGYYLMTPNAVWGLGLEAISSVVVAGLVVGLVAGIEIAASGETGFGARLAFIASTLFVLLFKFDIQTNTVVNGLLSFVTPSIPIGIGLFYPNMTSIFITGSTDIISIFGLIIVSVLMLMTVVSGLMIAAGEHG